MKKLLVLILIVNTYSVFAQDSDISIKFKANEEANVWIGKEWDFNYTPLNSPINVEFNGKKLKMYYDNGNIFMEIDVINYQRKEKKNYDKLEKEAYILKIEDRGFIQYLIIEKTYSYGSVYSQIKIPFVTDTGETMSYHYYQEF